MYTPTPAFDVVCRLSCNVIFRLVSCANLLRAKKSTGRYGGWNSSFDGGIQYEQSVLCAKIMKLGAFCEMGTVRYTLGRYCQEHTTVRSIWPLNCGIK